MATQLGALKRIRGFQGFNVDGFNYQGPDIVAYFLTHFHSDHTCGLHAGFKGPAPIYCSPVTGALLTAVMGVKSSMVRPMPLGVPFDVPTGDGEVAVATFIDANHCPGSVLVHLRHKATGRIVLHTGDFRAARCVREDQTLHALIDTHGKIDELLLDTTYCAPQWKFPDQAEACAAIRRREGDMNDGLWVALKCTANLAAICETPRAATANPSTTLAGASGTGCPTNWMRSQRNCYLPVTLRLGFVQAEQKCVNDGAHLVSIRSLHEQEFISRISLPWQDTWIGLSHATSAWAWSDTTRWSFSNWGSEQPTEGAKCGAYRRMEGNVNDATWVSLDCTRKMHSICKKAAVSTP